MALFFALVLGAASALAPSQVHLSLMDGRRVVTFVTVGAVDPGDAVVDLGGGAPLVAASSSTYSAGGWVGLIHRAPLPAGDITYRCGFRSAGGAFDYGPWHATTPAAGGRTTRLAVVADLGADCDHPGCGDPTIRSLNAAAPALDGLLHAGDIAYIKGAANEATYDRFFDEIEPVAAAVPYHACPGNQEHWNAFAGYEARFALNDTSGQLWHSVDIGVVHAAFLSTEHNHSAGSPQYEWLAADLAAVDRAATPWVAVLLHRPLYCSSNDYYDCVRAAPFLRATLEPLFEATGVDVVVAGHVHQYERTAPVRNGTVRPAGTAPVHVVVGNAGDVEGLTKTFEPAPAWARSRSLALGWARVTANATTFAVEHVASINGTVLDAFALAK